MRLDGRLDLVVLLVLLLVSCAWGRPEATAAAAPAGLLTAVQGRVEVAGLATEWRPARVGRALAEGDRLRTGPDGRAAILLADESLVRINRNSYFVLKSVARRAGWLPAADRGMRRGRTRLGLKRGELWLLNKNPGADLSVRSGMVTAAIRGTEFGMRADTAGEVSVVVLEGRVGVANDAGQVTLASGEAAVARPGEPPVRRILMHPEDAVQWTMILPRSFDPAAIQPAAAASPELAALSRAVAEGDFAAAQGIIEPLLAQWPDNGVLWEYATLLRLMANRKDAALEAAQRAVALRPRSAAAHHLLGLVHQARFDLAAAGRALEAARRLAPDDVGVLAALAANRFGRDDLDGARQFADQARQLAPDDTVVLDLAGFLALARGRTAEAAELFRRSLAVQPGSDAHLGLGLALMRQGRPKECLRHLGLAVLLAPRRALPRTYWARILYQLGRLDEALDVLAVSRRIDSRDPTPFFLEARILADLHRPAAALAALEAAMRRNGNRAVYRSRFLLDRDAAMQNVDFANLYTRLGLMVRARRAAERGVRLDYTNPSAHLFLAGLFRDQGAERLVRDSENLLVRLFQPANVNTFNTFNDYTALLERPDVELDLTVAGGNHHTLDQQYILFGAAPAKGLAFQGGAVRDRTAGWRDTNGETTDSGVFHLKWDLSPAASLSLSVSHTRQERAGNLDARFWFDAPQRPDDHEVSAVKRAEVGLFLRHGPGRYTLGRFVLFRNELDRGQWVDTVAPAGGVVFSGRLRNGAAVVEDLLVAEAEQVMEFGRHRLLAHGLALSSVQGQDRTTRGALVGVPGGVVVPVNLAEASRPEYRQYVAGVHGAWRLRPGLLVEAAAVYDMQRLTDDASGRTVRHQRVAPRLGVVWEIDAERSLQIALHRHVLPPSLVRERLDPVLLAGLPVYEPSLPGARTDAATVRYQDLLAGWTWAVEGDYRRQEYELSANGVSTDYRSRYRRLELAADRLLAGTMGLGLRLEWRDGEDDRDRRLHREEFTAGLGLRFEHGSGLAAGLDVTLLKVRYVDPAFADAFIPLVDLHSSWELPGKRLKLEARIDNLLDRRFDWPTDVLGADGRQPGIACRLGITVVL